VCFNGDVTTPESAMSRLVTLMCLVGLNLYSGSPTAVVKSNNPLSVCPPTSTPRGSRNSAAKAARGITGKCLFCIVVEKKESVGIRRKLETLNK
jgi:hypothetical protein